MGERCLLRGSRNRQSFIQIYFPVAALDHGFLGAADVYVYLISCMVTSHLCLPGHGFFGAADVYVYPISCMVTSHLSLPGIKGFCGTQNYQLKHVKSQANCTELFPQPELVASTPSTPHPGWRVTGLVPISSSQGLVLAGT